MPAAGQNQRPPSAVTFDGALPGATGEGTGFTALATTDWFFSLAACRCCAGPTNAPRYASNLLVLPAEETLHGTDTDHITPARRRWLPALSVKRALERLARRDGAQLLGVLALTCTGVGCAHKVRQLACRLLVALRLAALQTRRAAETGGAVQLVACIGWPACTALPALRYRGILLSRVV